MKRILLTVLVFVLIGAVHLDRSGTHLPAVLLGMAIVQGAVLLVAAATLTNAKWIAPIQQPLLSLAPLLFLFPFLVQFQHTPYLPLPPYPWLGHPTSWLDPNLFAVRNILALLGLAIVGNSFGRVSLANGSSARQWAVVYILTFVVVKTLVAVDWVMSFDYPWVSTMFPAIYMIECLYAGLALAGILCYFRERRQPGSTGDSVYDTASLLFGFGLFWGGLTFAQYLTIWYGNIPEEVHFFTRRFALRGGEQLFAVNVILLFVIPFTVFLIHRIRKSACAVALLALVILAGLMTVRLFHILPHVEFHAGFFILQTLAMLGIITGSVCCTGQPTPPANQTV